MRTRDEYATLRAILMRGASIARFGDGELKLCLGRNQILQRNGSRIRDKLRSILHSHDVRLLVGIPRVIPGAHNDQVWRRFVRERKYKKLYDENKTYYSAFITRPDSAPHIFCEEYWGLFKSILAGRHVVVLQGQNFCADRSLFDETASVTFVRGPSRNAFDEFDHIVSHLLGYPKKSLFLLSLGPCATVVAATLCGLGRQALDVGHLGMFYDGTHPKICLIPEKYRNADKRRLQEIEREAAPVS